MSAPMSIAPQVISRDDAERFAERIRLDLEGAADRIESAKMKIRTAIAERHDIALGYASPGAYLADRFSDSLSRLGVDSRREFVSELDAAGLSTRAIAAVTGTSIGTAHNDRQVFRPEHLTPEPTVNTETGEVMGDYLPDDESGEEAPPESAASAPTASSFPSSPTVEHRHSPRTPVVGLDGKTYQRPEPRVTVGNYLAADPRIAEQEYKTNYSRALSAATKVTLFDADRIADLMEDYEVELLRSHLNSLADFTDRIIKRRSGLRVVKGGQS